jgi:RimJ/RimL family protein N-acetyltransferase
MMQIVKFEKIHADHILKESLQPKPYGWEEMIDKWYTTGPCYTALENEKPVLCAGVGLIGNKTGEAWTLLGPGFYQHRKLYLKAILKQMDDIVKEEGLERVQSYAFSDHLPAHKMLEHLGFEKKECLTMFVKNYKGETSSFVGSIRNS